MIQSSMVVGWRLNGAGFNTPTIDIGIGIIVNRQSKRYRLSFVFWCPEKDPIENVVGSGGQTESFSPFSEEVAYLRGYIDEGIGTKSLYVQFRDNTNNIITSSIQTSDDIFSSASASAARRP